MKTENRANFAFQFLNAVAEETMSATKVWGQDAAVGYFVLWGLTREDITYNFSNFSVSCSQHSSYWQQVSFFNLLYVTEETA